MKTECLAKRGPCSLLPAAEASSTIATAAASSNPRSIFCFSMQILLWVEPAGWEMGSLPALTLAPFILICSGILPRRGIRTRKRHKVNIAECQLQRDLWAVSLRARVLSALLSIWVHGDTPGFCSIVQHPKIPEMRMPSLASSRLALCVGTNKACFLLLPTPEGFTKLGNVFLMLSCVGGCTLDRSQGEFLVKINQCRDDGD